MMKEKNLATSINDVNKELSQKSENDFTPWTWQWMKLHFHYKSYVLNDNAVRPGEQNEESYLKKRVINFAHHRAQYRYTSIGKNTRDLGGYLTANHKYMVKPGYLIRSENLNQISLDGLKTLHNLGVDKIIDLRDLHEACQKPDSSQLTIPVVLHPVYTRKGVNRSRNLTFRHGVIYRYHTLFFSNPHALKAYHNSIVDILHNYYGATLYHCVEGRDRTGIVSVLLLSMLGVNKHDIFNDYLLTDYYCHTKPYVRQYKQLVCFYKYVNKDYGSIYNYLHYIGITSHDICQLRKMYLEPINKEETLDAKLAQEANQ